MPRELTPKTRKNLWLIAIFFLLDGIIALAVATWYEHGSSVAFWSLVWGLVNIALGFGPVLSVLIATKVPENKGLTRQAKRE